jgi:hypothetical protein
LIKVKTIAEQIEREVLRIFGTPPMFYKIEACHLVGHGWRVNIWTKHLIPSGNLDNGIPYSFFVVTDDDGTIIMTNPPLLPRFQTPVPAPAKVDEPALAMTTA